MELLQPSQNFTGLLLFILGSLGFILGGLATSWLVRPKRDNVEKGTTYESGEDPVGTAWGKFNLQFYIVAIIFILFEVEIVFLFPWSVVFGQKELVDGTEGLWGWFALFEVIAFVSILILGLVYAWKKGFLDWIKPTGEIPSFNGPVKDEQYHKLNR